MRTYDVGPVSGYVEWDDTPSFAHSLSQRIQWHGSQAAASYGETVPAELLPEPAPPTSFSETVDGLAVREVLDADVFAHFFGATPFDSTR